MSEEPKRYRMKGDWVLPRAGSGFGSDGTLRAEIIDDHGGMPCMICDAPLCMEWPTLWTEPDADGKRHMLCHVSDCEMEDCEPPAPSPSPAGRVGGEG